MIAIESPTAARVASTAAMPSSSRLRIHPDLQRPEAFLAQTQRALRPGGGRQEHPARRVRRDPVERPAEQGRDRQAGDLAGQVPQRDLERPVAPGMEVDRLERPDVAGDRQRILADEQVLVAPRSRPSCRPEPMPTTPSSVSTRTSVTANAVRGTGSQAAGNGGSSGTVSRWSRIARDTHARAVSPTDRDAVLSRLIRISCWSPPSLEGRNADGRAHPSSRRRRVRSRHQALRRAHPQDPRDAHAGRGQRPVPEGSRRQDLRPGRTVRLRQDHVAQDGQPAHRADIRTHPDRRRRRRHARADGAAAEHRLRHPAGRPVPAPDDRRQRGHRAAAARLAEAPPSGALGRAPGARRPGSREVPRSLPEPALRRRAAARRRRPRPRGRPADHAHGRAVRRRRPDRPGPPPERVPAAAGDHRQDDPVRDPRHRRGDQDGRPRRRLPDRRHPRPVRPAARHPGRARVGVRRPLRRP